MGFVWWFRGLLVVLIVGGVTRFNMTLRDADDANPDDIPVSRPVPLPKETNQTPPPVSVQTEIVLDTVPEPIVEGSPPPPLRSIPPGRTPEEQQRLRDIHEPLFAKHKDDNLVPPLGVTGKLLWYRPRMAGVNNQLEEFWHALILARQMGRSIVLPYVAEAVSWDRNKMDLLHPYRDYFDPAVMSRYVATVTTEDFLERCNRTVQMDIQPRQNKNAANPAYERELNIDTKSVQKIDWSLPKLREKTFELPDCLGVNWPRFSIGGIISYKTLAGDPPLGARVERNLEFRRAVRHTWPAPIIVEQAKVVVTHLAPFLAIHHRVGDFRFGWCKGRAVRMRCPTKENVWKQIVDTARLFNLTNVLVAIEPRYREETIKLFTKNAAALTDQTLKFWTVWVVPGVNVTLFDGRPDVAGATESASLAMADVFIGNAWSTWSRSVHERRHVSGKNCSHDFLWERNEDLCLKDMLPLTPDVLDATGEQATSDGWT